MHIKNDKYFAYIYTFFILMGPLTPIGFWMLDRSFMYLPKFAYYPAMALIAWSLIKYKFILNDWLIKYLIFYSILIITFGLALNPVSKATFAHLFSLFLPIMAFSFGFMMANKNSNFFYYFEKNMISTGLVLSALILIYYALYQVGLIPYFGASTLIAIPIIYALHKKKYELLLFIVAALLTGKRTVILGIFSVFSVYFLWLGVRRPLTVFAIALATVLISYFVLMNLTDFTILSRFIVFFEEDVNWNLATSGRLNDVLAAITSINENNWFWLIGKGVGATFSVENAWSTDIWITHYTHVSPVSYVFLGGVMLALPIYFRFISLFIYAMKTAGNFYSLLFIYYFLVSFSGAILFTDPFVWVIAGIVFHQQKNKNKF
jgi:hypothetical protein